MERSRYVPGGPPGPGYPAPGAYQPPPGQIGFQPQPGYVPPGGQPGYPQGYQPPVYPPPGGYGQPIAAQPMSGGAPGASGKELVEVINLSSGLTNPSAGHHVA